MQEREESGAFDAWLKHKREQKKKEQYIEDQKRKEFDEGWYTRPRSESERAYRQYVFFIFLNNISVCDTNSCCNGVINYVLREFK